MSNFARLAVMAGLVCLLVSLGVGCRDEKLADAPDDGSGTKADSKGGGGFPEGLGQTPADEDPEVLEYVKLKGWLLYRDMRISDGKLLVFLSVRDKDEPFKDIAITSRDYEMIARSKTAEVLDLRSVQATDEGLRTLAAMPDLKGIIVSGEDVTDEGIQALAACKSLDNVSLLITKKVTDEGVRQLAALPKLRSLYLMGFSLNGSAFESFANKQTLQSLTLEMIDGLTDEGAAHIARLPNLDELKLSGGFSFGEEPKLTAKGIRAIIEARLPAKFEFNHKLIDDDLLASLVSKGWLYGPTSPGADDEKPATAEQVESISLDGSQVTDKGIEVVLDCKNVSSLFLSKTGITDETLKKFRDFKNLDYLSIGETKVTGSGLDAITGLPLQHLAMEECELTEEAFRAMAKMSALEELWLSDAKLDPAWLKHISEHPRIDELNLSSTAFDDESARQVASMPNLKELTVNNTKLGDSGFEVLVKLPNLEKLYVDGTEVTKEVYQQAKKERPDLSLYFYRYD